MSNEITEEAYRQLKRKVDEAKNQAAKAQGALDSLLTQLKEEFECSSLKEARAKLEGLEEARDEAQARYEKEFRDYERKWKA